MSTKPVLVFDMDGVLVEVTESYRETIRATVKHFTGRDVTHEQIQDYKNQGGWNNDWLLSEKICRDYGVFVDYQTVVDEFQKIFFGHNNDGLILREKWIAKDGLFDRLQQKYQLAIFTGRLRYEADFTLNRFCPELEFNPIMSEDVVTEPKPSPDGLFQIAAQYPGAPLVYVGDTLDDANSALAAKVPFVGIAAPGKPLYNELVAVLKGAGAIAVIDDINQLEAVLPQ